MSDPIDLTAKPAPLLSASGGTSMSSTNLLQQVTTATALTAYGSASDEDKNSWYVAMARAWGQALDKQADLISQKSNAIGNDGSDQPGELTQLTAESERFSFMANSASTATNSVGQGLDTLGRKQ